MGQRADQMSGRLPGTSLPPMVLAGGIGAALAFFFDPDRGRYRRNQARDRLAGLFHRASRQVERQARFRSAEIAGAGKRLTHLRPENAAPDDVTLAQRVQSEVFRNPAVPQGRLNINVEDGVVVLRGQLDRPDQFSSLEEAVRQVPGVNGVKSLLHLPGSGQQRSA